MEKACVIFCSLPVEKELLRFMPENALIIAADRGWKQAEKLGVKPHLVLGDFDSSNKPTKASNVIVLPKEKDETDSFAAVKYALGKGCNEIILFGAIGARADHTVANMQIILYATKRGAKASLISKQAQVYCMGEGKRVFFDEQNKYISVFAAGGEAKGVCLENLKYPLDNAVLTQDNPLGTSNEFMGENAVITCGEGFLYVMVCERD